MFYTLLRLLRRLGFVTDLLTSVEEIRSSGLFDEEWYVRDFGPLRRIVTHPVMHYVRRGARTGRNPNPLFDSRFYAARLSTKQHQQNPLLHYLRIGTAQGRDPCWWFDSDWYVQSYDVGLQDGSSPLLDYLKFGMDEGRATHPLFDRSWYLSRYGGATHHPDPIVDYIYAGAREGRLPHRALADTDFTSKDHGGITRVLHAAAAVKDPRAPRNISRVTFDHEASDRLVASVRETEPTVGPRPLVSIIMATRNRADRLPAAIASVLCQRYRTWELVVVDDRSRDATESVVRGFDDGRIRYIRGNGAGAAAARNIGLAASTGSLVAYLDSDNQWTPDFLATMVRQMEVRNLDLAYSAMRLESEEQVRFRGRDFDPDDLARVNYVDLNAIVHRAVLTERFGGFDPGLRRLIDWDLILRYARGARVGYVPFLGVVYDDRKRSDRISIRESINARYVVLNRHLIDWRAMRADIARRERGLVSIVIPVHGNPEITNNCLEAVFRETDPRRFEIVLVSNKSDRGTLANLALWSEARPNVHLVPLWTNLNFALGCNLGFAHTRGDTVIFLNNDTRVTEGWLDPLVAELGRDTSGVVQPKLLYPDGKVQSLGAVFSAAGNISHILYRGEPGEAPHVNRRRRVSAVHGACLAISAADFARLDGFDARFVNGQEDIDLCLRLNRDTGKEAVVVPASTVIHLEGRTRGRNPHNRWNRLAFVERWKHRVLPDADRIYAEDGFDVVYAPDSEEYAQLGIAVLNPRLTPKSLPADVVL